MMLWTSLPERNSINPQWLMEKIMASGENNSNEKNPQKRKKINLINSIPFSTGDAFLTIFL
jgi:hypothetical protein